MAFWMTIKAQRLSWNMEEGMKIIQSAVKLTLISLALSVATAAYAVTPLEPLGKNPNFVRNSDQRSNEIQGVGNKILDAASSARYQVRVDTDNTEYAYAFERLDESALQYTGDPEDIAGYKFFNLTIYIDGTKMQTQTTAFVPSEYSNAILFKKMDRDENDTYDFDLGMDGENRIYIITSPTDVVYLTAQETIRKPMSIQEKNKRFIY